MQREFQKASPIQSDLRQNRWSMNKENVHILFHVQSCSQITMALFTLLINHKSENKLRQNHTYTYICSNRHSNINDST